MMPSAYPGNVSAICITEAVAADVDRALDQRRVDIDFMEEERKLRGKGTCEKGYM